jgi:hypothetical protein
MIWEIVESETVEYAAASCKCPCSCGTCNCSTNPTLIGQAGRQGGYSAGNSSHNYILACAGLVLLD